MHGILTLNEEIKNGHILQRRADSASGGAGITIDQHDGVPSAI
jgi:hypothetical protein